MNKVQARAKIPNSDFDCLKMRRRLICGHSDLRNLRLVVE
jgi:hypothetical protein